jgi:glycosyltransferase involved in cell wall biosynthesis
MTMGIASRHSPSGVQRFSHVRAAMLTTSVSRQAGGMFWSIQALSRSLIDSDCDVRVFGGEDAYSSEDRSKWGRTPVTVLPVVGPRAFGFQRGLMNALSTYNPNLLHVQGLWMYPSMAAVRWAAGYRPYLVSPHGMLDSWAVHNSAWKKRLAGLLYENAHLSAAACLHALCASEYESIRSYGLQNPVAIIPNGVDLPSETSRSGQPDWNNLFPGESQVLLFIGRIHPKKGLKHLLYAWARVKQESSSGGKPWRLVIAGWPEEAHQKELERLCVTLGIGDDVRFVGPQFDNQKAASLARADAFILPSISEGLPMAVLEAWSYRLPVLMTPQCNLPEGFVAEAAINMSPDVASIAVALKTLFDMADVARRDMGERGRKLVENRFTWSSVASSMHSVYSWVLGRGPMPACVLRALYDNSSD